MIAIICKSLPQCIAIIMHCVEGYVHEISSTACSFDLRCESVTFNIVVTQA